MAGSSILSGFLNQVSVEKEREVVGALHLHSDSSDGGLSPEEILNAAAQTDLDFLFLSDHNKLTPVSEGYHGRILLLVGTEISPPRNHYLALGLSEVPSPKLSPQEFITAVRNAGGAGFLAHPFDRGNPLLRLPSYAWDSWPITDFDGLEVWNHLSEWCFRTRSPWGLLKAVLFPRGVIRSPDADALKLWDRLGRERPVAGIAGVDAHQISLRLGRHRLVVFPYNRQLQTLRTHLLLPGPLSTDGKTAVDQVRGALSQGSGFLANAEAGNARGFRFRSIRPNAHLGQEVPWQTGLTLQAKAPGNGEMLLLRDGHVLLSTRSSGFTHRAPGPGVYRTVVRRRWALRLRDWIISNPIYVRQPV